MVSGVARRVLLPRLAEPSQVSLAASRTQLGPSLYKSEVFTLQTRLFHASSTRQTALPPFSIATFRTPANNAPSHTRLPLARIRSSQLGSVSYALRQFSTAPRLLQEIQTKVEEGAKKPAELEANRKIAEDEHKQEFTKSEKATRAAQVNLAAKLSKEGKQAGKAGSDEIVRLIKIARPEIRWLGIAFVFLVISSSVTMLIPFSVGRILDLATKGEADDVRLFGLTMNQFFVGLGTVLTIGAMANFGRVILLRIIGERVVARLRSQLYRRTYVQDAEFFDANR
jgi:putative ABC transport system ATP-binding protein